MRKIILSRPAFSTVLHTAVFPLLACSRGEQGDALESPAGTFALLTPGSISDQSWNGGGYHGLIPAQLRHKVDSLQDRMFAGESKVQFPLQPGSD